MTPARKEYREYIDRERKPPVGRAVAVPWAMEPLEGFEPPTC
jgi:hypothetical protein